MKLVTILCMFWLLTLNAYAVMTPDEIDTVQVTCQRYSEEPCMEKLFYLIERLGLDYNECKWEVADYTDEFDTSSTYSRLTSESDPECVKPSVAALVAERDLFKAELTQTWNDKVYVDGKRAEALAIYNALNYKAEITGMVNPEAQWRRDTLQASSPTDKAAIDTLLAQVTAWKVADDALKVTRDAENLKNETIKTGKAIRECGESVKDLLLMRNAVKVDMTKQEVKTLLSTFDEVNNLLSSGSLETACDEIKTVPIATTRATEDDRTALIEQLNSCMVKFGKSCIK